MPLDQPSDNKEMTFLDHLEELRWHLVRGIAAVMVIAVAAFVAKDFVFGTIIFGPSRPTFWTFVQLCRLSEIFQSPALCITEIPFTPQSLKMTGQFTTHLSSSFAIGIILGFPYLFWEVWRFIKPGLHKKERHAARGATFSVSTLFLLGVTFGYFIIAPISVNFFANYRVDPSVQNQFNINSYVNTISMVVLASGLLFQLPVVVYFLTKIGLVSSVFLKRYRRHAIVVILILGAMVTPPDPFSQILIALPLFGLYQFSILIARRIEKQEARREQKESKKTAP